MGGKHIPKRYKYIFQFTCSIFLVVLIYGCQTPLPPAAPPSVIKQKEALNHLAIAEEYIIREDFENAFIENELAEATLKEDADFQKGMMYSHPKNPGKNYKKSIQLFAGIIKNKENVTSEIYNTSLVYSSLLNGIYEKTRQLETCNKKYQAENELTKELKEKIKDLEIQIENLKEVDLNIEEKKRNILKQNIQGSVN